MPDINPDNTFHGPIRNVAPEPADSPSVAEASAAQDSLAGSEAILITTPALEAQRQQEVQTQTLQPEAPAAATFSWGGYMQAVGLVGLLLVGLWLLMKLGRNIGKNRMAAASAGLSRTDFYVEGHLPLGQNKSLFVVRFLNTRLLLGVTDQHINLLSEAEANTDEENSNFQQVMESARLQDGFAAAGPVDAAGSAKPRSGPN